MPPMDSRRRESQHWARTASSKKWKPWPSAIAVVDGALAGRDGRAQLGDSFRLDDTSDLALSSFASPSASGGGLQQQQGTDGPGLNHRVSFSQLAPVIALVSPSPVVVRSSSFQRSTSPREFHRGRHSNTRGMIGHQNVAKHRRLSAIEDLRLIQQNKSCLFRIEGHESLRPCAGVSLVPDFGSGWIERRRSRDEAPATLPYLPSLAIVRCALPSFVGDGTTEQGKLVESALRSGDETDSEITNLQGRREKLETPCPTFPRMEGTDTLFDPGRPGWPCLPPLASPPFAFLPTAF
ncbi:hypothetical protein EDB81DRAFT_189346 [Dactylonectria macrodidyma]|uniref:Uncharacterized protein n=1 Tax=Dactylonectria macrodidyma TaxID=307937 RepID=A0A9P9FR72_9HYPO|nr:hypothetical protein EDB81DRAFT_189346 [Dactylonectria macrodidyma]